MRRYASNVPNVPGSPGIGWEICPVARAPRFRRANEEIKTSGEEVGGSEPAPNARLVLAVAVAEDGFELPLFHRYHVVVHDVERYGQQR
jgi:hypothetical protein